jgi:hypothetical protein
MDSDDLVVRDLEFKAIEWAGSAIYYGCCHTHALPSPTGVTYATFFVPAPDFQLIGSVRRQILDEAASELEGGA